MKDILTLKDKIRIYKQEITNLEKELQIKTTIEIPVEKFEVYHEDCYDKLNFSDAKEYCKGLGDGWMLPTLKQQLAMYDRKEELGLKDTYYWSSTEFGATCAFYLNFNYGDTKYSNENNSISVRAVRTIK